MLSIFFLLFFPCYPSLAVPCSGPVTYDTTEFTIRGPCPNDVLIAPVDDTVQYRCDYEEEASGVYIPYWHITGLSGSPFLPDEQNDHQLIVESSTSGTEGHTTLNITVLEQYLNKSLSIQCGICSISKCSSEPLSENITSQPVKLVAFSTPSSLSSVVLSDSVSLSWSPPSISADHTEPVDFRYEVALANLMNPSLTLQLASNDTIYNLTSSHLHIPKYHTACSSSYTWNVVATVGGRRSQTVAANETFTVKTEPRTIGRPSVKISPSEDSLSLIIDILVTTFQPLDTLNYSVCLNGTIEDVCFDELRVMESEDTDFMNVTLFLENWTLDSPRNTSSKSEILCDYSVQVNIMNECGQSISEAYNFKTDSALNCTSLQPIITNNTKNINATHVTDVSSTSSVSSTTKQTMDTPAVESRNHKDNDVTIIISTVSAGIFATSIISILILSLCVWVLKKRKGKFGLLSQESRVSSNSVDTPDSTMTVSNYLSPFEAVCAKQSYEADHTSSSAMQYSEPQILKSRTLPLTQPVKPTDNQSVEVQELPGYSEVHRPNGDCITMSSEKDDPSYVPAHEIRRKKLTIKETYYAELDVPPPTCPPPPVPGTTTYSTIKETETQMIHSESPT